MLVLGHVATATVGCHALDRRADLRWVIFFTLLADLVDKPLGLVVFRESINNGRVWFHSIAVNLVLTLLIFVARKPLAYALALWFHQLCDRMWMRPWVALWPLTGAFGYRELAFEDWVYNVLSPYNLTSEAVAIVVLALFARRHGLFRRKKLLSWLRTGALNDGGAHHDPDRGSGAVRDYRESRLDRPQLRN